MLATLAFCTLMFHGESCPKYDLDCYNGYEDSSEVSSEYEESYDYDVEVELPTYYEDEYGPYEDATVSQTD